MAKKFGPALTMIVGALMLTGCASTSRQTIDPSKLAAVSDGNCKAFAAKSRPMDANSGVVPDSLELANLASESAADAEGGADVDSEPTPPPALSQLPPFSASNMASPMPVGWRPWKINRNKTPTRYALTEVDHRLVLHAEADSSASGLYVPLVEREAGALRWMWKTRDVIRTADNGVSHREDSPLRIFVAFDGDRSTLPLRDQLMYEMARITTGREMPYATLMYIWGGRLPPGAVVNNPHTDRVRMIIVDSGTRHTGEWRCHERDLRADYRKAFGADPGKVIAVGLMTDTDNTKTSAESWYGDITIE
ncbi:DUF3047 family protein [Cupriavidus metallidurans]|jgi:hypothetical protein|uniref:DUF3047 domain-containing protein n=1 Tax=Cupriavidus metallidurans (strain ATCC 43123 / DSM 2839 / NBRC 102507 / CH34) TaxID=266264 RepID=Q1LIJ3_CUPMC|nr:DUF3047 domain-containing protein [Cupriavidus metallidurans]ABF10033.1 conserved hypothetical protein; putative exported protein [Cupriavidus metallidurans CH34]MDE4919495.1 DUF3047 domain-containing protein [Cupriavidus metallidurans]QGS29162.1 DUF3047 domain-containing protein [Cupriavidus metallidurans]